MEATGFKANALDCRHKVSIINQANDSKHSEGIMQQKDCIRKIFMQSKLQFVAFALFMMFHLEKVAKSILEKNTHDMNHESSSKNALLV